MKKSNTVISEENLKQKLFEFQKDLEDFGRHIAQSISLQKFAERFCSKLKEALSIENIGLLYKQNVDNNWEPLINKIIFSENTISNLKLGYVFQIIENPAENIDLAINIPFDDMQSFLILIGAKKNKKEFSSFEKVALNLLIQFLKNSYQAFSSKQKEKSLRFLLNERSLQLNNLIETGISISNINNQKKILELALQRVVSLTNSSRGYLKVYQQGELVNKYFFPTTFSLKIEKIKPEYILSKSFTFLENDYELTIFEKESRTGIIPYEEMDELILDAISRQVKAGIENEYLYNEILERKRKEQESSIANSINEISKPKSLPKIKGLDIFAVNLPASNPDADYYDIIPLSNGSYAFIIADVIGKGITASIVDTILKATLYALLESEYKLEKLAEKLNHYIYNIIIQEKKVTCIIGMINMNENSIEILNAGHISPIISNSNSKFTRIEQMGISLGNPPNKVGYTTKKFNFGSGERLLLFTNGIYDSNFDSKLSNNEYLENFFMNFQFLTAREFIENLISNIKGKDNPSFDLTAMYIKRN